MTSDRILNPCLEIIVQPKDNIKYQVSCDQISNNVFSDFFDISLECMLKNFLIDFPDRELFLVISLVNESENLKHLPSPNSLYCKNQFTRILSKFLNYDSESFLYPINQKTMKCKIDNLRIIKKTQNELNIFYEYLAIQHLKETHSNFQDIFSDSKTLMELMENQINIFKNLFLNQLDVCKLKLQVLIYNINEKKFENFLTEPIYSNIIHNKCVMNIAYEKIYPKIAIQSNDTTITNLENLRILRSSRTSGSIEGGEEMILLTTFFDPNDIEVEFIQMKNNSEVIWRSLARINKADVHANFALVFKIPKYTLVLEDAKKGKLEQKIRVMYRLFRPSTKQYSEKWAFFYVRDNNHDLKSLLIEQKMEFLSLEAKKIEGLKRKQNEKVDIDKDKDEKKIKTDDKIVIKKEPSIFMHENNDENREREENIDENSSESSSNSNSNDNNRNLLENRNEAKFNSSTEKTNEVSNKDLENLDPAALKKNIENCISKMNALADRTGKSLLKFAKTRSFHDLIKTQRFLINVQDDDGNTPIHLCILYRNFDLLEIFVDVTLTIPYQSIINIRNYKSMTPLLIASYMGEKEVCEFLLECNADLGIADYDGNNSIHIACKNKNIELLKLLIKYADKQCNFGVLNSINHDGYAPIHLCVLNESYEMVRELLYCKELRINIPDKRCGFSALHHAASNFNANKIVELLVKNEKIDINCKSYTGCTPLHMAIANKNYLTSILLIRNGADVNVQNDIPIHFDYEFLPAILSKNFKLVEDHLKKKASSHSDEKEKILTNKNEDILNEIIKTSEEVKKIFSNEFEFTNEDEAKGRFVTHNYDSFTYALNDVWMQEIFKNHTSISKDLLIKIACFERLRKEFYNKQTVQVGQAQSIIKSTRDIMNSSEFNSFNKMEKISQQEIGEEKLKENNQMEIIE